MPEDTKNKPTRYDVRAGEVISEAISDTAGDVKDFASAVANGLWKLVNGDAAMGSYELSKSLITRFPEIAEDFAGKAKPLEQKYDYDPVGELANQIRAKWEGLTPEQKQVTLDSVIEPTTSIGGGALGLWGGAGAASIPMGIGGASIGKAIGHNISRTIGPYLGAEGYPEDATGEDIFFESLRKATEGGAEELSGHGIAAAPGKIWAGGKAVAKMPFKPSAKTAARNVFADKKGLPLSLQTRSDTGFNKVIAGLLGLLPGGLIERHRGVAEELLHIKAAVRDQFKKLYPKEVSTEDFQIAGKGKVKAGQLKLSDDVKRSLGLSDVTDEATGIKIKGLADDAYREFDVVAETAYAPVLRDYGDVTVDTSAIAEAAKNITESGELGIPKIDRLIRVAGSRKGKESFVLDDTVSAITEAPQMTLRELNELRSEVRKQITSRSGTGDTSLVGLQDLLDAVFEVERQGLAKASPEGLKALDEARAIYKEASNRYNLPHSSKWADAPGNPAAGVPFVKRPADIVGTAARPQEPVFLRHAKERLDIPSLSPERELSFSPPQAIRDIDEGVAAHIFRGKPLPSQVSSAAEEWGPEVLEEVGVKGRAARATTPEMLQAEEDFFKSNIAKASATGKSVPEEAYLRASTNAPTDIQQSRRVFGDDADIVNRAYADDALRRAERWDRKVETELKLPEGQRLQDIIAKNPAKWREVWKVNPEAAQEVEELAGIMNATQRAEKILGNPSGTAIMDTTARAAGATAMAGLGALGVSDTTPEAAVKFTLGAFAVPWVGSRIYNNPRFAKAMTSPSTSRAYNPLMGQAVASGIRVPAAYGAASKPEFKVDMDRLDRSMLTPNVNATAPVAIDLDRLDRSLDAVMPQSP